MNIKSVYAWRRLSGVDEWMSDEDQENGSTLNYNNNNMAENLHNYSMLFRMFAMMLNWLVKILIKSQMNISILSWLLS